MLCRMNKVLIGAQQNKPMPDAKLRNERINSAHLNTRPAACISEARCGNVVVAVGRNQRERRQTFDDLFTGLGTRESLKKFLQNKPGGHHHIRSGKRLFQRLHFRLINLNVAPQRERPNARIDQERHLRERSAL